MTSSRGCWGNTSLWWDHRLAWKSTQAPRCGRVCPRPPLCKPAAWTPDMEGLPRRQVDRRKPSLVPRSFSSHHVVRATEEQHASILEDFGKQDLNQPCSCHHQSQQRNALHGPETVQRSHKTVKDRGPATLQISIFLLKIILFPIIHLYFFKITSLTPESSPLNPPLTRSPMFCRNELTFGMTSYFSNNYEF